MTSYTFISYLLQKYATIKMYMHIGSEITHHPSEPISKTITI